MLLPASSASSPGRAALAIRSKTANVHLALLSAGSHNTPVKILPGEPIEVWILPDGPDATASYFVAEIDVPTLQRNGGVTLTLVPGGDGKWTTQVEPCSGSAEDCSRAAIAASQAAGG